MARSTTTPTSSDAARTAEVDADLAGAVRLLLDRARRTLAAHRPGIDSWCAGCAAEGTFMFHPCPYHLWAEGILRQYGPPAGEAGHGDAQLDT